MQRKEIEKVYIKKINELKNTIKHISSRILHLFLTKIMILLSRKF